jgi:hypothetical protein
MRMLGMLGMLCSRKVRGGSFRYNSMSTAFDGPDSAEACEKELMYGSGALSSVMYSVEM